ncbi:MAG TPA: acyl carrier protein [Thermoanaerobaculia bacterium]|nr:acyl carrier protein [Thermoanaerobaculia bacterium]
MTPQDTIAHFLVTRFRAAIRRGEIGFDEPLISSGIIDSFGVLEVIAFLEDTFRVVLDPTRLPVTEFETVNRITALVERARQAS